MMPEERAIWAYPKTALDDDGVTVVANAYGLLISVSEEVALDSYNSQFTCSCSIPWSEVDGLISMINAARPDA